MEVQLDNACQQQILFTVPSCEDMMSYPMLGSYKGSWWVLSWDIDVNIAELKFKVIVSILGIPFVNIELNPQNPKVDIGYDNILAGELGLDVNAKEIYIEGKLFGKQIRVVLFRY